MNLKRISIIDLGTNTFNLLVAEWGEGESPKILFRTKYAAKIGKNGVNQNKIMPEAILRAKNILSQISKTLEEFGVSRTFAYATSAIRMAENGKEFVQMIERDYNIPVEVISGGREAELIYCGTQNAVELNHEPVAIIDIGGGSNEIIIANDKKIFWKNSYPLGMVHLLEKFSPSNPISKAEVKKIEKYLKEQLPDFFEALELHPVKTLIGSSGSFDTFKQILLANAHTNNNSSRTQFEIKLKDFFRLHQTFLASTLEERKQIPGMDVMRVELIVIASIFINFLVKETGFSKLYQSSYALKEGALFEKLENMGKPHKKGILVEPNQ